MDLFETDKLLTGYIKEIFGAETSTRNAFHTYGCSYRGFFQSSKSFGQPIPFESGLARDALRLFELAPNVITIIAEPSIIKYILDGKLMHYRPDYLLRLRDGSNCLAEIKYQKEANKLSNITRFDEIHRLVELADGQFVVLTDKHLRVPVLLKNMSLLERYRHVEVSQSAQAWLHKQLYSTGKLTFIAAADQIGRSVALAAIAQGIVTTDIRNTPISDLSVVVRS